MNMSSAFSSWLLFCYEKAHRILIMSEQSSPAMHILLLYSPFPTSQLMMFYTEILPSISLFPEVPGYTSGPLLI